MSRLALTEIAALTTLLVLLLTARQVDAAAHEPLRVATLLPFVAEAVELTPERASVVAGVRRSIHVPLPDGIIDLGSPHSPSFEGLAQAHADLVVGDAQLHAAIGSRLEALGAEVLLIDTTGIEATLASLEVIDRRLGGTARSASPLGRKIAEVREGLAAIDLGEEVSVLALFGAPGSFYAVTERAWLGQLLRDLGFRNLAPAEGDERLPGLVVVSDEVVATLSPDLVVLVAHGDPKKIQADLESRTAAGGAWAGLRKAKRGIHVLDPGLFSANPGLDLERAAAELVSLASGRAGTAPAAHEAGR